jgi:hypothetical protein
MGHICDEIIPYMRFIFNIGLKDALIVSFPSSESKVSDINKPSHGIRQ